MLALVSFVHLLRLSAVAALAPADPAAAVAAASLSSSSDTPQPQPPTPIHAPGYCAIFSSCGKQSFFGPELPCPTNIPATDPDDETRAALVDICGTEGWSEGPICCDLGQVSLYIIFLLFFKKKQKILTIISVKNPP